LRIILIGIILLIYMLLLPLKVLSADFNIQSCEYYNNKAYTVVVLHFDIGLLNDINEKFDDGLIYILDIEFEMGDQSLKKSFKFYRDSISNMYIVKSEYEKRFRKYENFKNFVSNLVINLPSSFKPQRVRAVSRNEYLRGIWSIFGFFVEYKTNWVSCSLRDEGRKK